MLISSAILALVGAFAVAQTDKACGGPTYELEGYGAGTTGGSGPNVEVTTCEGLREAAKNGGNIRLSSWLRKCGVIDVASNTTIRKSGRGGGLYDSSLRLYNVENVIIRDIPFQHSSDNTAAILLDGAKHVWLDHLEFKGVCPSAQGSWITVKANSDLLTVSWNIISDDCGGVEIDGGAEDSPHVTLHHNYWFFLDRNMPKLSGGVAHIHSNCADVVFNSGITLSGKATALVEYNIFMAASHAISTADESSATERHNAYYESPFDITKEGHVEPDYEYNYTDDTSCLCNLLMTYAGPSLPAE
jgi:pectate lyase